MVEIIIGIFALKGGEIMRNKDRPGWEDRPYLVKTTHSLGNWHFLFTPQHPEEGDEPMEAVLPGWLTPEEVGSILDCVNLETNLQCQNIAIAKANLAAIRAGGIIAMPAVVATVKAAKRAQGK